MFDKFLYNFTAWILDMFRIIRRITNRPHPPRCVIRKCKGFRCPFRHRACWGSLVHPTDADSDALKGFLLGDLQGWWVLFLSPNACSFVWIAPFREHVRPRMFFEASWFQVSYSGEGGKCPGSRCEMNGFVAKSHWNHGRSVGLHWGNPPQN